MRTRTRDTLNSNWHWYSHEDSHLAPPMLLRKGSENSKETAQVTISSLWSACIKLGCSVPDDDRATATARLGPDWGRPSGHYGRFRCANAVPQLTTIVPLSRLGCAAGQVTSCRWSLR